jgi:hypothetical protein
MKKSLTLTLDQIRKLKERLTPDQMRSLIASMWWYQRISEWNMPLPARVTLQAGQEAWARIKSSPRQRQNWRDWQALSDCFEVLEATCAKHAGKAEGGAYARLLAACLHLNGLDDLDRATRGVLRKLRRHQSEIEIWRNSLPPEERMKLNNPRTVWEHWRKSQQRPEPEPNPT